MTMHSAPHSPHVVGLQRHPAGLVHDGGCGELELERGVVEVRRATAPATIARSSRRAGEGTEVPRVLRRTDAHDEDLVQTRAD